MRKVLFLAVCLTACGSSESGGGAVSAGTVEPLQDAASLVCAPGKQEACACVGGEQGAQRCDSDGMAWGECKCQHVDSGVQDVAVDTHEPVEDSAADVVVDVVDDTEMDSGADASGLDASTVVCPGSRFVVVDTGDLIEGIPFDGQCKVKRNGIVYDTQTGLSWSRYPTDNCNAYECHMFTYQAAVEYCAARGMRLPTDSEIYAFIKHPLDECAFPCNFASWISDPTCKYGQHTVEGYGGGFCSNDTDSHRVMCVKP